MKSPISFGRATWIAAAVMAILVAMMPAESRGQTNEPNAPAAFGPEKGSLLICGGGTLPEMLRAKVLELAGGEHARLVVISTASQQRTRPMSKRTSRGGGSRSWRR